MEGFHVMLWSFAVQCGFNVIAVVDDKRLGYWVRGLC